MPAIILRVCCSATGFLNSIERPTLIINSTDDPFMTPEVIPPADNLSDQVTIEVSEWGGHVGYISGGKPWKPTFYLPDRITDFLDSHISGPDVQTHAMPGL